MKKKRESANNTSTRDEEAFFLNGTFDSKIKHEKHKYLLLKSNHQFCSQLNRNYGQTISLSV